MASDFSGFAQEGYKARTGAKGHEFPRGPAVVDVVRKPDAMSGERDDKDVVTQRLQSLGVVERAEGAEDFLDGYYAGAEKRGRTVDMELNKSAQDVEDGHYFFVSCDGGKAELAGDFVSLRSALLREAFLPRLLRGQRRRAHAFCLPL